MLSILLPALRLSLVTCALCGIAYPFAVTALGQWLLPYQASGSLERAADGTIVGSHLIGQQWADDNWFHGRPSATMTTDPSDPSKTISAPYNAANSGASNLGPTRKQLAELLLARRAIIDQLQPELAGKLLPADMITSSSSGLDPHISPANAAMQVARVARALGVPTVQISALLKQHMTGRSLGTFGEPHVNVLALNLALQRTYPKR